MPKKITFVLRVLVILCTLLNIFIFYRSLEQRKMFPPVDKLKIVDGFIHHPTFGKYPEKVDYYLGMPIFPGQIAENYLKIQRKTTRSNETK